MTGSSTKVLRVAIGQVNLTVGDLDGNTARILECIDGARDLSADIVILPELAITGYPPEDLLLKAGFVQKNLACLDRIVEHTLEITAVVGFVDGDGSLFNAAAVISNGKLMGVQRKVHLPNYGVFDEERYFEPGNENKVYLQDGVVFGVEVCEDSWHVDGPHRAQALVGEAEIILTINSSPFHAEKWQSREDMLAKRAQENCCYFVYGNLVGGQDELVFDGHSMTFGPDGRVICRGPAFGEDLVTVDLDMREVSRRRQAASWYGEAKESTALSGVRVDRVEIPSLRRENERPELPPCLTEAPSKLSEIYGALALGTRDYVRKNGFERVVLGVSGGIDSALTAVVAADGLGAGSVVGVVMPSEFSSEATQSDAVQLCEKLGIQHHVIPIQQTFESYLGMLADVFEGTKTGVAEENIQARIRGNVLMALSNKFGWLVLTTGNKSEVAVGYSTLYGDMAGGLNVLKDVPKTMVYDLAGYRNSISEVIPQSIIERPPSAELRPDQRDVDSLPPYEVLDPIIHAYVEEDKSISDIVRMGFEPETVQKVAQMIDRNEYKRRQSPPGIKITPKAFGRDRRLPITNRYREEIS